MDTNLIINYTNGNKRGSKAISNINPEKTNAILDTFAQKVNALTTNTYVDAIRVNKQSVKEPDAPGGGKTEGVITFENGVVTYNGDGTLYYQTGSAQASTVASGYPIHYDGLPVSGVTIYFFATATDNYTAAVLVTAVD